jgi:hypothetical protein
MRSSRRRLTPTCSSSAAADCTASRHWAPSPSGLHIARTAPHSSSVTPSTNADSRGCSPGRSATARAGSCSGLAAHARRLIASGSTPDTCAMDKGYDSNRVHAECVSSAASTRSFRSKASAQSRSSCRSSKPRFNPRIQGHTEPYRKLYRGPAAVEREFGRLKHDYGFAPLRARGAEAPAKTLCQRRSYSISPG